MESSYGYALLFCVDLDQLSSTFLDNQSSHSVFPTGHSIFTLLVMTIYHSYTVKQYLCPYFECNRQEGT